jgi:hypothetical protein
MTEPTPQQQAAREAFVAGHDLALVAGAGTGKTSTLGLMGSATRKRGLYIAFNRSTADDARARFGRNLDCRTAHSIAFRTVGRRYRDRLDASARIPAKKTAELLGIGTDLDVDSRPIKTGHQARLAMGMVRRFCYRTDRQVMARHMERVNGLDDQEQQYVAQRLLPYAQRAWQDITSANGRLRFEHDHYLKIWAMTDPVLPGDFILLDEAQDTNPVLEEVFLSQDAQRVCVGDPAQQIYSWRNARDVMTGFPAEHLHLTESFRFGPAIASVANRWLGHAESEMELTGHGPPNSKLATLSHPDAVLCRGNADAMAEILAFLELGTPVALTGGGRPLERIATAALELKAGKRTSHPELFLFRSWGEVQDYVEHDKSGQDLRAIVQLVDTHGPDEILSAVRRLSPEQQANVTVSTAHKAKGREWPSVRIGGGFDEPSVDDDGLQRTLDPAEARLIYVAVSRARDRLDTEGVSWIDDYETAINEQGRDTTAAGRPTIELSLTGQLRFDSSPISSFMTRHLPRSADLLRDYVKRIRGLPRPIQPVDVQHPQWSSLGHTIDYRLRISLGGDLGPAVSDGVAVLGKDIPLPGAADTPVRSALYDAGLRLLTAVRAYLTDSSTLDEETLTRLCFVAGFYEDIIRTGTLRRFSALAGASPSTIIDDLCASVPDYVVADIDQQMQLADGPFTPLRALPAAVRVCGPVFAGSGDIGGADADFILDGLLLDCKSSKDPHKLGRAEIYQLAGYLLLDYHDEFRIDRVGLYLSRQGGLITWDTTEFLDRLGADAPLSRLRIALANQLKMAAGQHACTAEASFGRCRSVPAR